MSTYPTYKNSGIEWLGDIPHNWEVNRLKNMLRRKVTDGPHETPEFTDDGIPFLSVDGIQEGELVFENCRFISKSDHLKYQQKVIVEKGDVLMGKAASTGKIAQVKTNLEFNVWSPLAIIKPTLNRLIPTYLEYCLKSYPGQIQIDLLCTSNTQKNISMDDIPKIILPEPSYNEQTAIANYLDEKISKLDQLISNKKAQIEQLKEVRQIEINTAVTKGLDPIVKLKPSGIEWLGNIPEHWEHRRLKDYCYVNMGQSPGSESYNDDGDGLPFYQGNADFGELHPVTRIHCTDPKKIAESNDVLISVRAPVGEINIADAQCCIGRGLAAVQPIIVVDKFLYYQLIVIKEELKLYVTGSTFEAVSSGSISVLRFLKPPKDEQTAIVNYLDEKTSRIDKLVSNLENQIEQLEEIRKIEIYNAVTGKIKVTYYGKKSRLSRRQRNRI